METDCLAELIDQKLTLLVQLLALARRQAAAIDETDLTALLKILAGKQQLVTQLQHVDRSLAPYSQQNAEQRVWATLETRARCQQQSARCEAVLREILLTETTAEANITARRDSIAQQLTAVNQSTQAQRAYVQLPRAHSVGTFDFTSES